MKILHIAKECHPEGSGVGRHIKGLVAMSRTAGIEATVLTAEERVSWAALARAAEAVDLIHLHGARTLIVAQAAIVAGWVGRPIIYTPHCYYDHGTATKRIAKRLWDFVVERRLVKRAATTILLDVFWQEDLRARGLRPKHVAIIPNCITAVPETATVEAASSPSFPLAGAPALLSIGRLDPVKRLDDAIAALGEPGLERAILHLIGVGHDRSRLEREAGLLGLADRVVFHGHLDDRQAGAARAAADLFLLPSGREGLPTTMLETLAAGRPVLASDIPANRAVAETLGWPGLFPVGNRPALARAILRWAGATVPDEVKHRLAATYIWAAHAPDIIALYRSAAKTKDRKSITPVTTVGRQH